MGRVVVGVSEGRPVYLRDVAQIVDGPEEAADYFLFLCSDRASYSVGSAYFVDGGMLKTV